MEKSQNKKYYDALKEYYVERRADGEVCDFYHRWMNHKYRHTMKVIRAGKEIIKNEPLLWDLSEDIKDEFVNACLFHDFARSYEVDPKTGKHVIEYHGLEGAKKAYELGARSLNILIPVMVHDMIECDMSSVPQDDDFVKKMKKEYDALSEDEKAIVYLGIRLVKDADMLDNFRNFERMYMRPVNLEAGIDDNVKKDLLSCHLVHKCDLKTFADDVCMVLACGTNFYFPYVINSILDDNIIERLREYFIMRYQQANCSCCEFEDMLNVVDKGIIAVKANMEEHIALHSLNKK